MTAVTTSNGPRRISERGAAVSPAVRVFLVAVFFVPVQLDLEEIRGILDSRLAPTDLLLVLAIVLDPRLLLFGRRPVDLLPVVTVGAMAYGVALALIQQGDITNHAFQVKFIGAISLAILGLVAATVCRRGHARSVLRALVAGTVLWTIVSYVDWQVFDILPFLDAKTITRFGGMQHDPNNAGSLFAVVVCLMVFGGGYVFRSRWAILATFITAGGGLALTYSRGGYLALGVGVVAGLLVSHKSAERMVRFGALALAATAIVVVTGVAQDAIDDFSSRPDNVGGRNELASAGIDAFTESGGVGVGLGAFRAEQGDIIHNTALWLLVELSVVGVALFLAWCILPAAALLRSPPTPRMLLPALFAAQLAMVAASVTIEASYQRHWWVVMGVIAGTTALASPGHESPPGLERTDGRADAEREDA